MMTFNKRITDKSITNHEGEKAWKLSPEMELYTTVVTASLDRTFYEAGNARVARIQVLVAQCDPQFVAKLAIYTRQVMYLRSVPVLLVIELARHHKGDNLVSTTLTTIIQRADEITEALACYQLLNPRPGIKKLKGIAKQVQKGIAAAFLKFDEYQFAKYNRNTEITLKDALFITHPKAQQPEQQVLFDKIVKDELAVPYTWEVELSRLGQESFPDNNTKQEAFKAKWSTLIASKKLGYMALMRNLRNILQAKVEPQYLEQVAGYLANPQAVRRSKQLPFRFLAAYQELTQAQLKSAKILLQALETAVICSTENLRGFTPSTRLLIACDVSGSMFKTISTKSSIKLYDIGLMLAMLFQRHCKHTVTGIFGSDWMTYSLPSEHVLRNIAELKKIEGKVGYSTNGYKVIDYLLEQQLVMDKVFMFTDMQMWDSHKTRLPGDTQSANHLSQRWSHYKTTLSPDAKLYLFDLAGYGQAPLALEDNDVYLIAGWNDKVFDILHALEEGESTLSEIQKLPLPR